MKLKFNRTVHDEFVRIMHNDTVLIAISSESVINPGLWMNVNEELNILGVDLIW